MSFERIETTIPDVFLLRPKVFEDDRGFFFESYHAEKLAELGIHERFVQDNHSRSSKSVLRGLHFQDEAAPMAKLVRCTLGSVVDVAIDLRVGSPTFGRHVSIELSSSNHLLLFVPVGFAHGFQVTSDVAEIQYKCSSVYAPRHERAVRWDDAELAIDWPLKEPILSTKDQAAPSLRDYLERPSFHFGSEP